MPGFARWILERTRKFPKHQRFVMARRIEDAALDFHDCLIGAVKVPDRGERLRKGDLHLERLKTYNRLCRDLKLLSFGQYEHLAGRLDELGRLLGGWQKRVAASLQAWNAHAAHGTTWRLRRDVFRRAALSRPATRPRIPVSAVW